MTAPEASADTAASAPLTVDAAARVREAVALIARTPGYAGVAADLAGWIARERVRFVPALEDRGQATLTGRLLLGPEALSGHALGLAETLVHEHFHLRRQTPLAKTASFWGGALTGRPVMRAYEAPAYRAALEFLAAVGAALPEWSAAARAERDAVLATFAACYGGTP